MTAIYLILNFSLTFPLTNFFGRASKGAFTFLFFVIFFPTLALQGMSVGTGEDFYTYVDIINSDFSYDYLARGEFLSFFLMRVASLIGSPQFFFFANVFIFAFGVCYLLIVSGFYRSRFLLSFLLLFLFFSGWIWSGHSNLIRQYTASPFLLASLYLGFRSRFFSFQPLMILLVAFSIHSMSLFLFLVGALALFLPVRYNYLLFALFPMFYGFFSDVLLDQFIGTPFSFLSSYRSFEVRPGLLSLVSEFTFLPIILIWLAVRGDDFNGKFFGTLSLVGLILSFVPVALSIPHLERLSHSFKVADVFVFAFVASRVRPYRFGLIYIWFLGFLTFVKLLLGISGYFYLPGFL